MEEECPNGSGKNLTEGGTTYCRAKWKVKQNDQTAERQQEILKNSSQKAERERQIAEQVKRTAQRQGKIVK